MTVRSQARLYNFITHILISFPAKGFIEWERKRWACNSWRLQDCAQHSLASAGRSVNGLQMINYRALFFCKTLGLLSEFLQCPWEYILDGTRVVHVPPPCSPPIISPPLRSPPISCRAGAVTAVTLTLVSCPHPAP